MKRTFTVYASTGGTTLSVTYQPYRPGYHDTVTKKFVGNDLLDALCNMVDRMTLYFDSDDILDNDMSPQDVINRIDEENGDGCDMIYELKDLSTGKTYISEPQRGGHNVEW